jgi:hypothetical protein
MKGGFIMAECKRCSKKGFFLKVNKEGLCCNCVEFLLKSACPYCGSMLEKIPKRKSPCPNCQNVIFVRNKKMVTERKATMIDFIKNSEFYGAYENEYLRIEDELKKKFGFEPNPSDIIWAYYNKLIVKNSSNYQNLSSIYYSMALILNKEKKEFFHILQQSKKMELLEYKRSGFIKKVKISTSGKDNACDNCLKQENKTFTINAALEKMPIPNKDCTHILYDENRGFCRCCYITEVASIEDVTNKILRKMR